MPTEDERTWLAAAEEGFVEKIRHFLAQGTCPDTSVDGWTALEKASINNQCNIIRVLIESGADPNRADEDGLTSIYWTAKNGHVAALETLIACGAQYDNADISGSTPLHYAAESGHKEVASALLKRGAHPGRACKKGNTPLHLASKYDHQDVAELIIACHRDRVDPNTANDEGESPLLVATRSGNTKVVKVFLDHEWASCGERKLVKFLRLHQALAIAARERHHDIYGLISQKLNTVGFHWVMSYNNKSHKDDTFHKTALEWAVKNKDNYMVSELLRHEYEYHQENKEQGLLCLQSQLTHEENLKQIISQFTNQYPKTQNEKRLNGFLAVLPILWAFSLYLYDIVFDGVLTHGYYLCSNITGTSESQENCEALKHSGSDYWVAFASIVIFMVASLGAFILMMVVSKDFPSLIRTTMETMYGRHHQNTDDRLVHQYNDVPCMKCWSEFFALP